MSTSRIEDIETANTVNELNMTLELMFMKRILGNKLISHASNDKLLFSTIKLTKFHSMFQGPMSLNEVRCINFII